MEVCLCVMNICEAALLGACRLLCVERCPWCGVGFGMDAFLLGLMVWCVPVLCEYMRVLCLLCCWVFPWVCVFLVVVCVSVVKDVVCIVLNGRCC